MLYFLYQSVDGPLDWFGILAIMNKCCDKHGGTFDTINSCLLNIPHFLLKTTNFLKIPVILCRHKKCTVLIRRHLIGSCMMLVIRCHCIVTLEVKFNKWQFCYTCLLALTICLPNPRWRKSIWMKRDSWLGTIPLTFSWGTSRKIITCMCTLCTGSLVNLISILWTGKEYLLC